MHPPKKKVLIITYYFPPSGGAGVQRTLKFVKYLRNFGWEPVVLTAKKADYPAYDESLQSEIPEGVKVYRSRIIEPYRLYRKFTGRRSAESADIATLTLDEKSKRKMSERISEWLRSVFFIPDARIAWLFFATRLGKKILQTEKIDVIFSSAPPYTTHLIGLKLHRHSGLPWVVDFRDSWIGWVSAPQWRPKVCRKIEMRMEEAVLREGTKILTVSNGVKEDLLSRHPKQDDQRWQILSNGFDLADFENVQPKPKSEKITITYSGSMYGARNPEYLLQALESLQKKKSGLLAKLQFRFVGRIWDAILNRIESSAVSGLFEIIPYVPHAESLAYLMGSDILLLIIDDSPANKGILTGKLFEYIGAGKPILALAPEGEAAHLIRSNNLGKVAPPKDVDAIQNSLQTLVQDYLDGKPIFKMDSDVRKRFERREQAGELARLLTDLDQDRR